MLGPIPARVNRALVLRRSSSPRLLRSLIFGGTDATTGERKRSKDALGNRVVPAVAAGTALALFVDALQDVKKEELAALITALHRTAQRLLPIVLVGAGLSELRGQIGRAKSYAERRFDKAR